MGNNEIKREFLEIPFFNFSEKFYSYVSVYDHNRFTLTDISESKWNKKEFQN